MFAGEKSPCFMNTKSFSENDCFLTKKEESVMTFPYLGRLGIIAVTGKNRELLSGDRLLRISIEHRMFNELTRGHIIIMDDENAQAIGYPIPSRKNIVISSKGKRSFDESYEVCYSFDDALDNAIASVNDSAALHHNIKGIFFIGGRSVFDRAIEVADHLFITVVSTEFPDVLDRFPNYENMFPKVRSCTNGCENEIYYKMFHLERSVLRCL